jgi:predicted nucleotidyltransferase
VSGSAPPDLSGVPNALPQKRRLAAVAADLWRDPNVCALWLGGSLARGTADAHSDVDLRVAVSLDAFDANNAPASARQLTDAVVAGLRVPFGDDAVLHHLLLGDGEIYDLFVQTTQREPSNEARLVLACRPESGFAAKLAVGGADPVTKFPPADPDALRELIGNFWIGQQKHQKVLARGLTLLAWEGEHRLRQDLIRLLFALATGNDCGPVNRLSIHSFSPVEQAVRREWAGDEVFSHIGRALTCEREIVEATAQLRNEVARVGRRLAEQFGFVYPEAAEATVRQTWQRFTAERE